MLLICCCDEPIWWVSVYCLFVGKVGERLYCLFVGKILFIMFFNSIFQFVNFTLIELKAGSKIRDRAFGSLYSLS